MKKHTLRILEEIFPFIFYVLNKKKLLLKIFKNEKYKETESYLSLPNEIITRRITEEHKRALGIDEKTAKYTLSLSLFLSFLSGIFGLIYSSYYSSNLSFLILLCFLIAAIYMLIAGLISLSSLRTLPLFGYGTTHEIKLLNSKKSEYLANTLLKQEKINSTRHLANETTYMCLRNGIILLIIAIILICIFPVQQNKVIENKIIETNISANK